MHYLSLTPGPVFKGCAVPGKTDSSKPRPPAPPPPRKAASSVSSRVEVPGTLVCYCTIGTPRQGRWARAPGPPVGARGEPGADSGQGWGRRPAWSGFPVLCRRMRWPCLCHVHLRVFARDWKKGTRQGRGEVGRVLAERSWSPEPTCSPGGLCLTSSWLHCHHTGPLAWTRQGTGESGSQGRSVTKPWPAPAGLKSEGETPTISRSWRRQEREAPPWGPQEELRLCWPSDFSPETPASDLQPPEP